MHSRCRIQRPKGSHASVVIHGHYALHISPAFHSEENLLSSQFSLTLRPLRSGAVFFCLRPDKNVHNAHIGFGGLSPFPKNFFIFALRYGRTYPSVCRMSYTRLTDALRALTLIQSYSLDLTFKVWYN